jgi:hypothetical protein
MSGTNQSLDRVEIVLKNNDTGNLLPVYLDVYDNSLSHKWLSALNNLLKNNHHLEKNYCFFGFADGPRNGAYLIEQINNSINAINQADIGYTIDNHFTLENSVAADGGVNHNQFNLLHRYFEDLQGVSGRMSPFYTKSDDHTRWHIRQLNLLCHEFESWQLSWRKKTTAPEWQRPSQLMCWLNAPRFTLDETDYELFGIETINRSLGGVYIGVNKAVGKHHWEVYNDEGRDSRIDELTTTSLRSQTEAAGDFDIEWANDPGAFEWQKKHLVGFRQWLTANGFDPEDKSLTIGHPKVGQVDLEMSFGTTGYHDIWQMLNTHLDVYSIKTSSAHAIYKYNWSDKDYMDQQILALKGK